MHWDEHSQTIEARGDRPPSQRPSLGASIALTALLLSTAAGKAGCSSSEAGPPSPTPFVQPADVTQETSTPTGPSLLEGIQGGFIDLTSASDLSLPISPRVDDVDTDQMADVTTGLFADLDGDGRDEVILSSSGGQGDALNVVLTLRDGTLSQAEDISLPNGIVAALVDFDRDGLLDALSITQARPPLYWGTDAGSFGEPVDQLAIFGMEARLALHLTDLDRDGWLDIVAPDGCSVTPQLKSGLRTFRARPDTLQGFATPSAYALFAFPFTPSQQGLVVVGNPGCGGLSYATFLEDGLDSDGYPRFEPEDLHPPDVHWLERSPPGMEALSFQAPMGGVASDLDYDGLNDLVLTIDPTHVILKGNQSLPSTDVSEGSGLFRLYTETGADMLGWAVTLADLNQDGYQDLIIAHGDDNSALEDSPPPPPGPMMTTVHLNRGDLTFEDVTSELGLSRGGQWRALTLGDPDHDGDADLIVGGSGENPRIYLNAIQSDNEGFSLELEGTTSNQWGVGAVVEVFGAEVAYQRHIVGASGSPNLAARPILFIGLGSKANGVETRVTWPSGQVQSVMDLEAGTRHKLVEPALLRVEPVGRKLPASQGAGASVLVTPSAPNAIVTATVTHGVGSIGSVEQTEQGGWKVDVSNPGIVGSCRVEIYIDDEPVGIKPRIWWQ